MFVCEICRSSFQERRNLTQHVRLVHNQRGFGHLSTNNPTIVHHEEDFELKLQHNALRGYLRSYVFQPTRLFRDPVLFLNHIKPTLKSLVQSVLLEWDSLKLYISLSIKLVRGIEQENTITPFFSSTQRQILQEEEAEEEVVTAFDQIMAHLDELISRGSSWTVESVQFLHTHFAKYKMLRGGQTFEKLPKVLQAKGAIINVINDDDCCFMWSVLASKHPTSVHAERLSHYEPFVNELNFKLISFPVKLKDISRFEHQNNVSINVFGFEDNKVLPYRISKLCREHHVDLMLYKGHYSWIKNLDRLLGDQRKHRGKKYFCPRCLLPQYEKSVFDVHIRLCRNNEPTRVEMPSDNIMKFRNHHRSQRASCIMYADFECLLIPMKNPVPNPQSSYSVQTHVHMPCGFGLVHLFQCCNEEPQIGSPIIYRGEDCVPRFLETVFDLADQHASKINNPKPLRMSDCDWKKHQSTTVCSICTQPLSPFDRVRDHCHFCSSYRGTAHNECNIAYRNTRNISVFFHNLKRYDSHILMKSLGAICNAKGLELHCIARTMEEYISFTVTKYISSTNGLNSRKTEWKVIFVDSYQFLSSSLDSLASNLRAYGQSAFKATSSNFVSHQQLSLMLRKGVYPYEYMDSWERFLEKSLPSKEHFYSSLTRQDITDRDYEHGKNVWDVFGIADMGEYHDLYLKTDVLLLCDVFENFRYFCLQHYKLDPAHYLTLPSFGFDACLRMTNVELELLSDANMYAMFETGIRGGISVVSHRFSKANNPYLQHYDPTLPSSYLLYIDVNNLYGAAMVEKLPLNTFKWLSQQEIAAIDWKCVDINGDKGYVLEVDLAYPNALHNAHSDYPLAPERLLVENEILSPYCQAIKETTGCASGSTEKLIPNLRDKTNYILHLHNLQLYLHLGLELKSVNRAISFNQSAWMVPYVEFNTTMRKQANNDFDKDLFKLLNNAVFGKTMENVREYLDVKLVTTPTQFSKLAANPRYKFSTIFTDDLVGVSMHKKSVKLCKPIFVGFTILELSKVTMFQFHYSTIKPRYGEKAKLCFTDTDSFIYEIETPDIYDDIASMHEKFDTSNYPTDNRLFSDTNKKKLGKMKDEMAGKVASEFVGLRSKMYSLECDGQMKMCAKGVQRSVLKTKYRHSSYRNVLLQKFHRKDRMNAIRSINHTLYTIEYNKLSLSPFDDKRYILSDGISTLPYFHADIMDCSQ